AIDTRRVRRWRFRKRGEHRRFGEVDPSDGFAEQVAAGGFDAVHAVPHVDHVQVVLEDLLLRELLLEQTSNAKLDELAERRAAVGQPWNPQVTSHESKRSVPPTATIMSATSGHWRRIHFRDGSAGLALQRCLRRVVRFRKKLIWLADRPIRLSLSLVRSSLSQ